MDCWNIFRHFGHMKQDPQTLMLSRSAKEVHMNKLNQHTKKNIQKKQAILEMFYVKQTIKQSGFSRAFWGKTE